MWWLNADRGRARAAFIAREELKPEAERIRVRCFDRQMDEIELHFAQIKEAFKDNIIAGLQADGSQRPPQDIWTEIKERRRG